MRQPPDTSSANLMLSGGAPQRRRFRLIEYNQLTPLDINGTDADLRESVMSA